MKNEANIMIGFTVPNKTTRVMLFAVVAMAGFFTASLHAAETAKPAAAEVAADDDNWQVPVTLNKDGWMIYHNPRFGCVLPVPAGMKPLRPPDNGDGQAFVSADGKVTLIACGGFNVDNTGDIAERWKNALAEPDRTITYKRKTDAWFVISGVCKDGTGFYEKYTANKNYFALWTMTYPQAEEKKYAAWVERIAKGYEARLGKGGDTLPEESAK